MQSLSSDYLYTQPISLSNIRMIPTFFPIYNNLTCPMYAPVVKDGICRLCQMDSNNHRKYYIYSNFARKIQLCFFKYLFKKFYKKNFNSFKKLQSKIRPFPVLVMIYKIKYYRNWNTFTLYQFTKNTL